MLFRSQPARDGGEHLVADAVTETVVDRLEVIQVTEQDGDRFGRLPHQLTLEPVVEGGVVGEQRQGIRLGLPLEVHLQLVADTEDALKLREGQPVGTSVTLRGERMWEFLDRLVTIALPRVRDFKGVSPKGFDGRGNYTLGLRDQLLFPEIDYMKVDKARGMNVSVVTTAKTDEEARKLLQFIGMPFRQ